MAPKKRKSARVPVVNISHVIDQPLHVLANAINALRGRPDPLAPEEALGVANETVALLQRGVAAIDRGLVHDALPASLALLLDGIMSSDDAAAAVVHTFTNGLPASMEALDKIFTFAVMKASVPIDTQVDVVEVMQTLCGAMETKEAMGARFMSRLATLLSGPQPHFALHRALAAALINLVKSSKENKLRLPSYKPVCVALMTTTDFFLQLQCFEILYRVTRQHPRILDALRGDLPQPLYDGLRQLSNVDLLERIAALLESFNLTREPQQILQFDIKRCDVAETTLTAATKAFFAPEFFLVFLPRDGSDNLTIEYSCIRSIRFKGGDKVVIRLREPPASIASRVVVGEEGKDCLVLWLDDETVKKFKSSKLHSWVRTVIQDAAGAAQSSALSGSGGRLSHNRLVSDASNRLLAQRTQQQLSQQQEAAVGATPPQHNDVDDDVAQQRCAPAYRAPAATPCVALRLDMSTPASEVPPARLNNHNDAVALRGVVPLPAVSADASAPRSPPHKSMVIDDERSHVLDLGDSGSKRHRSEFAHFATIAAPPPAAPQAAAAVGSCGIEPLGLSPLPPPNLEDPSMVLAADDDDNAHDWRRPAAATARRSKSHGSSTVAPPPPPGPTRGGLEAMLQELQSVVDTQARTQHAEALTIVADLIEVVQEQVSATRRTIAKDRDEFKSYIDVKLAPFDHAARTLRQTVDDTVATVNASGAEIKQRATQHRQRVMAVEGELRSLIPRMRGREDEEVRQLKRIVEEEICRIEAEFNMALAQQPAIMLAAALRVPSSAATSADAKSRGVSLAAHHLAANSSGRPTSYATDSSAGRLANSLARVQVS